MAARTVLHVGTMKTGTSHIQSRLFANQDALLRHGILVPGETWTDQALAVTQIRDHQGVPRKGAWPALTDQIAAHEGAAVISMEFMGTLRPQLIEALCSSLTGVEAVITVRDLNRNLAAMWQETLQNGRSWTWEEYVSVARNHGPGHGGAGPDSPLAARNFWGNQNVVRIARNWSRVVPVTLLTVPPPEAPHDLLWHRFSQAIGAPEDGPQGGWAPAGRSNESLGLASLQLLRRLNEHLDSIGMEYPAAKVVRKKYLAKEVLVERRADEPSLGLPVAPWMRRRSALMVRRLQALELGLVGGWEDLEPVEVPGVSPDEVPDSLLVEAAVTALGGMLSRDVMHERELVTLHEQLRLAQGHAPDPTLAGDDHDVGSPEVSDDD